MPNEENKVGSITQLTTHYTPHAPDVGEIPEEVISAIMLAFREQKIDEPVINDYRANQRLEEIAAVEKAYDVVNEWSGEILHALDAVRVRKELALERYIQDDPTHEMRKLPAGEIEIKKSPDSVNITVDNHKLSMFYMSPTWTNCIKPQIKYLANKRALLKRIKGGEVCPFAEIKGGEYLFHYRLTAKLEGEDEKA
jgi:hypothetical protein